MGFSKQTGQRLILFLLAIAAYMLLYQNPDQANTTDSDNTRKEQPTAYINGATFLIYNQEGAISTQLNSRQALYFSDSERIAIQSPDVILKTPDGQKINITADEGVFFPTNENLQLKGSVKIEQSSAEIDTWQLNTEALELNSLARFISTDQAVTIRRGKNLIQATGLKAWLDEKKIDLLSDVRGHYVYQKPSP